MLLESLYKEKEVKYTRIIIWSHTVKSLSRRVGYWGKHPPDFYALKNLKPILQQTIIVSFFQKITNLRGQKL